MTDKDKMREEFELKFPMPKGLQRCVDDGKAYPYAPIWPDADSHDAQTYSWMYRAWQASKESSKEPEAAKQRIEKQKADLDARDDIIDDFNIAVSCINPKEDMCRAITALLAEKEALEKKLAEQQAYIHRLCGTIDLCHIALVDGDSMSVKSAVSTIPNPYPVHSTEELTKLLAAARHQGFEEGSKMDCKKLQDALDAAHQAGRDEVQREMSEREPVAEVAAPVGSFGYRHLTRCSIDIGELPVGMKLIPRPLPPEVKGE